MEILMCDRCKKFPAVQMFAWQGDESNPVAGWCMACSKKVEEEDMIGMVATERAYDNSANER